MAARVFSLIGEAAISTQPSAKRPGELVVGRERVLKLDATNLMLRPTNERELAP